MTESKSEGQLRRAQPHIGAAVFCEHILHEKDGVNSLIRIVDTFTVPKIPAGVEGKAVVRVNGFLMFKSGDAKGKYEVRLRLRPPAGDPQELGDPQYIVFDGGEHGAAIIMNLALEVKQPGLSWIDVIVDGELMTRMPFRLRREEESEEPRRSTSS